MGEDTPAELEVVKGYIANLTHYKDKKHQSIELVHQGDTCIWVDVELHFLDDCLIRLRTESDNGPIVSGAKFGLQVVPIRVCNGNPSNKEETFAWVDVTTHGYEFKLLGTKGGMLEWRRTHNRSHGSSWTKLDDYKLVDPGNDKKVLAAYIKDNSYGYGRIGHFDFYVNLKPETELQSISAIFAIEQVDRAN